MVKAASPMRLDQDLVQAASDVSGRYRRSIAEQVEYWAGIGRSVEKILDPDTLLSIQAGLSSLRIVPKDNVAIDVDDVFARLEADRRSGRLAELVSSGPVRYQASPDHLGLLERIDVDGRRTLGQFRDGEFVVCSSRVRRVTGCPALAFPHAGIRFRVSTSFVPTRPRLHWMTYNPGLTTAD
jgi:hypothetical protein